MEIAHQESRHLDLEGILTILFKHKYKMVPVFLLVCIAVVAVTLSRPPVYEATASMLVKFGREYIYRPEVGDAKSPMISFAPFNQEEAINSEIAIITSLDLIEKVVTTLGVEKLYPKLLEKPSQGVDPLSVAVPTFAANLHAGAMKRSNVMQISFQHGDPEVAAKAVNLLIDLFKEKRLQVFSDPQSSFLQAQLNSYDQKLRESENKLEFFKQKNQVFSLDQQKSLLLQQRMELDTSLKNSQNQVHELQTKLDYLKARAEVIPEVKQLSSQTERDSMTQDAKARLLTLQLKEQDLLRKYSENNRLVVSVREEIALVQDFLKKQEGLGLREDAEVENKVFQDLETEILKTEAELNAQLAKVPALRRQIDQIESEMRGLNGKQNELQNLNREIATNEKNYLNYADKLEEASISEDMNKRKMGNISVIEAATVPAGPIKPNRKLGVLLGMILGGAMGLSFAFVSEYASQGLSTPESAERHLNLPVLATFPYQKER